MVFYGAIHIAQQQTSKELIADKNLLAQCPYKLNENCGKSIIIKDFKCFN